MTALYGTVVFLLIVLAAGIVIWLLTRSAAEKRLVERRMTARGQHEDAKVLSMRFADLFDDQERIRKHIEKDGELALAMWRAGYRSAVQRATLYGIQVILPLAARQIQLEFATEKVVGVQTAQQQIGVGNGDTAAAPPIADRAGGRTGTLRSDPQHSARVDPRDAAPASADRLVAEQSARRSVISSPSAHSTPGVRGIITRVMPSARASRAACTGPAPPKAFTNFRSLSNL